MVKKSVKILINGEHKGWFGNSYHVLTNPSRTWFYSEDDSNKIISFLQPRFYGKKVELEFVEVAQKVSRKNYIIFITDKNSQKTLYFAQTAKGNQGFTDEKEYATKFTKSASESALKRVESGFTSIDGEDVPIVAAFFCGVEFLGKYNKK